MCLLKSCLFCCYLVYMYALSHVWLYIGVEFFCYRLNNQTSELSVQRVYQHCPLTQLPPSDPTASPHFRGRGKGFSALFNLHRDPLLGM